jgi:hypothetical protein
MIKCFHFCLNIGFKLNLRRYSSAFRLIGCVEQYLQHAEELTNPVEVFAKLPASPAVVTGTGGALLSMLMVGIQRALSLVEEGWSYGGDMGAFVPPDN